jgi:hypothetical protein
VAQEYLEHCLDTAHAAIREASVTEPPTLSDDAPQYELQFDDRDHYDNTIAEGPSARGEPESAPTIDVTTEELKLFEVELQKAFVPHGTGMEVDISVLCNSVATNKSASYRYALLLCCNGVEEFAQVRLAQLIAEAWQAEFRNRSLRDVVEEVAKQIATGGKPSLEEIANISIKRSST